ncbi:T9SS type A sorting domain-containing protein [Flavobacterium sp.]
MKKITLLLLFAAPFYLTIHAQGSTSFESAQGFALGDINGQNLWQSTIDGAGIFPTTQTVSNDVASFGTYSLRLQKDPAYGTNINAFLGAVYNFPIPVSTANMTFSADVYMTEQGFTSMSMVFGLVHFDTPGEARYRTYFNLDYAGYSDVLVRGTQPGTITKVGTTFRWQLNTWHTIKIVTQGSNVSFYADGTLLVSNKLLVTDGNVDQIRFAHDNYDGFAYIDNVKVEQTLSTSAFNLDSVSHFYNKDRDELVLNSSEDVFSTVSVYNLSGQNVLNKTLSAQKETVDFSKVSNGVYLVSFSIGNTTKTIKVLKY